MTLKLFLFRLFGTSVHDEEFDPLLEASRNILAEKCLNPERVGCPDLDFLRKLARHSVGIDELKFWTPHLSSCGECFREFQSLKRPPSPIASGSLKVFRRLIQFRR
jgi:hypothetical protein